MVEYLDGRLNTRIGTRILGCSPQMKINNLRNLENLFLFIKNDFLSDEFHLLRGEFGEEFGEEFRGKFGESFTRWFAELDGESFAEMV